MISILVLTLNEENNLPRCLETVKWSDDIHVLDSYSSDKTVEIAKECNAKIWFRKFDSFSQHQNWALENIPFRYPWVFYIDADERVTPKLAEAMQRAVANPDGNIAFSVQRRDFFLETWLKHVQMTAYYDRLFRPEKMHYERLGHCISKPGGPVANIDGYLDHYPFSKGLSDWIARHNFYSTQEAQQIIENRKAGKGVSLRALIFEKDGRERRRNVKELYYRMPFRPLVKFFAMYVLKRGFMDGVAGFTYSTLMGFYELMIVLKTAEMQENEGCKSE
ncbi:MAG TPA: glycosyltransferase family 2 protein [Terracidiphilus sp.]|nr:glycosyltransferase family 2 protein [Terracidiphilus sp.]